VSLSTVPETGMRAPPTPATASVESLSEAHSWVIVRRRFPDRRSQLSGYQRDLGPARRAPDRDIRRRSVDICPRDEGGRCRKGGEW